MRSTVSSVANGAVRTSLLDEGGFVDVLPKEQLDVTKEQIQVVLHPGDNGDPPPEPV